MDDNNTQVMADDGQSFPSFIALRARHSELLQREPETDEAKSECLKEMEEFITRVQATGKILSDSEARRGAQNILNYWVSTLYRHDQVARLVTLADYEPNLTSELLDVSCPYPGVEAFREKKAPFFFGRQRQIDYMVGRLKEDRLLVIVGPSGSGKTSLVQAGLLPQLKKEKPDGIEHYYFPTFSPGTDPLKSLALMIREAQGSKVDDPHWVKQQVRKFREDQNHLVNLIKEITDQPIVIFIDEGEELYERSVPMLLRPLENILDLDNSKATIEPFLDNLLGVIQRSEKKNIVIIARRAGDFEPYVKRLPARVKEVFEPARVILPPLSANELRDAIEKPAELLGVNFEEIMSGASQGSEPSSLQQTMVQALIKDISSEPVGLPLLQFVLPRLWEAREGKIIPDRAYSEMESCQAYLAKTADDFYSSLNASEQKDCGYLIRHLVKLDRDLKPHIYPIRRGVLCPGGGRQSQIERLIKRLEERQLLRITKGRTSADDLIELVHDSLFRNWPKLSSWIDDKRSDRMFRRVRLGILTAAAIVLVVATAVFFYGRAQRHQKARELARLSGKQFNYDRFDLAMLLGTKAFELNNEDPAVRSNHFRLLHALQSTSRPDRFLFEKGFEAEDMIFSSESDGDPKRVAAVDNNGKIIIWNIESKLVERRWTENATYPLGFSGDGKFIAAASREPDVSLTVWNLENGQPTKLTSEDKAAVTSFAFKPGTHTLVAGDNQGNVISWDLDKGETLGKKLYYHWDSVNTVVFNSDGKLMATGGDDGWAMLWDTSGKISRRRFFAVGGERKGANAGSNRPILSLAFNNSENENLLAAGGHDHVFIWDLISGGELSTFSTGPSPAGILVSFSDEKLLTAFSFDGTIVLWDLEEGPQGAPVGKQFYNPSAAPSAALSNNGQLLAMPSDDGVVLWKLANIDRLEAGSIVRTGIGNTVGSIAFSPHTSDLVMASLAGDGSLTTWKADKKNRNKATSTLFDTEISSFAVNWDGSALALGLKNAIRLRDIDNHEIRALNVDTGNVVDPTAPSDVNRESPFSISKLILPTKQSPLVAALVEIKTPTNDETTAEGFGYRTKVLLWNTDEAKAKTVPSDPNSIVTSLAISPDGRALAWGSVDIRSGKSTVVVEREGQKPQPLPCGDNDICSAQVSSLAFSDNRLAAGFENGQIILWNSTTMQRVDKLPMQVAGGVVTDLAFGLDGTVLAAVSNKKAEHRGVSSPSLNDPKLKTGEITLWDVKTREPIGNSLRGHRGNISTIAFSPDGTMLASGSDASRDPNIILWDLNIKTANDRFCRIALCDQQRSEIVRHIDERSWAQSFYETVHPELLNIWRKVTSFRPFG